MRMLHKFIAASATLAVAAPAAAQYYGYGYQSYGAPYGAGVNTTMASQQCSAAVQNRLYARRGLGSIIGSLIGVSAATPQVLSVTSVSPRYDGTLQVRGLATSGRYTSGAYDPYGVGAYGALGYGYNQAADLSFRCDVGYNGAVYNVSISRRY